MKDDLLISVLCPVRLQHDSWAAITWLKKALESVARDLVDQPHEVILIDDFSDVPLAAHLVEWSAAPGHEILRNPMPQGLIRSLNRGIANAKGKYIARIDGDDEWTIGKTRRQLDRFVARPELALSFGSMQLIDEKGHSTDFHSRSFDWSHALAFAQNKACPVPHGSILVRTDIMRSLGGYPYEPSAFHAEDFALWSTLFRFFVVEGIGAELLRYRVHPQSASQKHAKRQADNSQTIMGRFRDYGDARAYVEAARRLLNAFSCDAVTAGLCLAEIWRNGGRLELPAAHENDLRQVLFDRGIIAQPQAEPLLMWFEVARF